MWGAAQVEACLSYMQVSSLCSSRHRLRLNTAQNLSGLSAASLKQS